MGHSLTCVDFWAKTTSCGDPGVSVQDHCINVGCVARALLDSFPPILRNIFPAGIATLAALHDLGKISPGFQVKCPAWIAQNNLASIAQCEDWPNHEQDHGRIHSRNRSLTLSPSTAMVAAYSPGTGIR